MAGPNHRDKLLPSGSSSARSCAEGILGPPGVVQGQQAAFSGRLTLFAKLGKLGYGQAFSIEY
jgi:hypothetical protein